MNWTSIIEALKENISWIKDVGMLFFAGTGTVLAILTYRRARATVLQPIRNEVVKKQSELLTEVLNLSHTPLKIDNGFDYLNIVRANVFSHLRDYGFIFKDQTELLEAIEKNISGWMPCGNEQVLKDVEIVGSFLPEEQAKKAAQESSEYEKTRYENAKKGLISINKIYLTHSFQAYTEKIGLLSANPFLPASIQKILYDLLTDVHRNLEICLRRVIEDFLRIYFQKVSEKQVYPAFSLDGVYNDFNHQRTHHGEMVKKLLEETRKYLRIDESWE